MKSQIAKHLMFAVFAIPLVSGAEQVELLTNLGCKVILDDPQIPILAIRSAVWSGDCRNGYIGGAGELVLFLNTPLRETFTGTAFRGSPLKGSYTRQDGTKYEGEFDPSSRRFFRGTRFSSDGKPLEAGLFDGLGSMVAGKSTVESNEQFEGSLFFGEPAQVPDYKTGAGIYDGKLVRNGITIAWFADGKRYVNEADYNAAYARARKAETDANQKSAADTARKIAQIDAETAQRREREAEILRKLRDEDRSAALAVLGAAAGALGGNTGAAISTQGTGISCNDPNAMKMPSATQWMTDRDGSLCTTYHSFDLCLGWTRSSNGGSGKIQNVCPFPIELYNSSISQRLQPRQFSDAFGVNKRWRYGACAVQAVSAHYYDQDRGVCTRDAFEQGLRERGGNAGVSK